MNRSRKQAHPITVERSTISASGGHADAVRWVSPFQTGGRTSKGDMILICTTPLLRGRSSSSLWLATFTKRRTRRGTTRIPRDRCGEAKRGCASHVPPLDWRNGAPHERGAGGESDPPFLAAGAARGRAKEDRGRDTLCPPLRGGRSHHSDPWREGHRAGHSGAGQRRRDRPQLAHWPRPVPGGPWLLPRCPTRGTSGLPAGRGFRAESIRSDSTIDASIHGQEGPPKSDSKRWV